MGSPELIFATAEAVLAQARAAAGFAIIWSKSGLYDKCEGGGGWGEGLGQGQGQAQAQGRVGCEGECEYPGECEGEDRTLRPATNINGPSEFQRTSS